MGAGLRCRSGMAVNPLVVGLIGAVVGRQARCSMASSSGTLQPLLLWNGSAGDGQRDRPPRDGGQVRGAVLLDVASSREQDRSAAAGDGESRSPARGVRHRTR